MSHKQDSDEDDRRDRWKQDRSRWDDDCAQTDDDDEKYRGRQRRGLPESVAVLDGYQSAGALSDGGGMMMEAAGSVCSQGSGTLRYHGGGMGSNIPVHFMNGETRFPSAFSYAASEAAKSDNATVCSGSIIEDIEVASVYSAGGGEVAGGVVFPSPPSSERTTRRNPSGGRVEFAAHLSVAAAASLPPGNNNMLNAVNDMGPPLSRALLLQHPPTGSRPGSVKSFCSSKASDVVAHVDTDDCGGSLVESVTDGQSIHSQEDGTARDEEVSRTAEASETTNPLLQNDASVSQPNGRTSPGGTVYKGRGVRRYQGRYMHLPLTRFHQNGVTLNNDDDGYRGPNGYYDNRRPPYSRGEAQWRDSSPPRWSSAAAREDDDGYHRQRSRSRSPARKSGGRRRSRRSPPPRHRSHRSRERRNGERRSESPSSRHRHRRRHRSSRSQSR